MTVEQFISDLDELVEAVRKRLSKTKVAIFGHSWGSVLGRALCRALPGEGRGIRRLRADRRLAPQRQNSPPTRSHSREAQRRGNRRAVRKLRGIGPPPYPAASVFTERTWVVRFEGGMRPRALWKTGRALLGGQESSIFELPGAIRGFRWSMDAMWPEVSKLNLIELAPVLPLPVFLLLGRRDHWVPPETSVAYLDALTAPSKQLVWFEYSSHEPFVDEPGKFNGAMRDLVRPGGVPPGRRGRRRTQAWFEILLSTAAFHAERSRRDCRA